MGGKVIPSQNCLLMITSWILKLENLEKSSNIIVDITASSSKFHMEERTCSVEFGASSITVCVFFRVYPQLQHLLLWNLHRHMPICPLRDPIPAMLDKLYYFISIITNLLDKVLKLKPHPHIYLFHKIQEK